MDKELQILFHHMEELQTRCYMQGRPFFSDFLSLEESSGILQQLSPQTGVNLRLYGGYEGAERQLLVLSPDDKSWEEISCPICCIRVEPLQFRFHDDLSHRDYLGALMHLGMERSVLGDIVIHEEVKKGHTFPVAYIFCLERICNFITTNLTQIRHTHVSCTLMEDYELQYEPAYEELTGTVASERLDAVLAFLTRQSRSQVAALLAEKKVYVNHICMQSGSYHLKEEDRVRIRGFGKYIYQSTGSFTKKGRLVIHVLKYI